MKTEWILVLNGSQAKILKEDGLSLYEILPAYHKEKVVSLDKDGRRLGRVTESHETMKHAHTPREDYKDKEKKEFIKVVAGAINDRTGDYDSLVISAPDKILSLIHEHLLPSVKEKIRGELRKDLLKFPLKETHEHLEPVLRRKKVH